MSQKTPLDKFILELRGRKQGRIFLVILFGAVVYLFRVLPSETFKDVMLILELMLGFCILDYAQESVYATRVPPPPPPDTPKIEAPTCLTCAKRDGPS
jgi:hypothetical protein